MGLKGKADRTKAYQPCGSSAFKNFGECVSSCCIEVFECFENVLDEMTDDLNNTNGIEIALGFLKNVVQILENFTL